MKNIIIKILILLYIFIIQTNKIYCQFPPLDEYMNVVSLIQRDDLTHFGTGFLVSTEFEKEHLVFVTNKHLTANRDHILLRINKTNITDKERSFIRVRIDLDMEKSIEGHDSYFYDGDSAHFAVSLYEHPNDSVDVSCFKFPAWAIFDIVVYQLENIDLKIFGVGDPILFVTFLTPHRYLSLVGESRNLPFIRSGIISRVYNEPIRVGNGYIKDYIMIDSQVFGGNSGSPVFLNKYIFEKGLTIRRKDLVGLIAGHVPTLDPLIPLDQQSDFASKQNYGIGIVQRVDKILEVINLMYSK